MGTVSAAKAVTVKNTGTTPVKVSGVAVSGAGFAIASSLVSGVPTVTGDACTGRLLAATAITAAGAIPSKLTWTADGSTGLTYTLQQSTDGGLTFTNAGTTTAKALTLNPPAGNYQFRVQAKDALGHVTASSTGPSFTLSAVQEGAAAIAYTPATGTGSWTSAAVAGAFGGSVESSSAAPGLAAYTFTGSGVELVSTKGPDRGKALVSIDCVPGTVGCTATTVDLYQATQAAGRIVFLKSGLAGSGTHTLYVKVLGTKNASSTGTRVDLDALVSVE